MLTAGVLEVYYSMAYCHRVGAQQVLFKQLSFSPQGDSMHTDFVENMLTVHKKYRDLIQEVFQGDQVNQCRNCI